MIRLDKHLETNLCSERVNREKKQLPLFETNNKVFDIANKKFGMLNSQKYDISWYKDISEKRQVYCAFKEIKSRVISQIIVKHNFVKKIELAL